MATSRREVRLRGIGVVAVAVGLPALIVVVDSPRAHGAWVVAVALLAMVCVDSVMSMRAVRRPELTIMPIDEGDVNDEVRILFSARHRGRPLLVSLAGARAVDRFLLAAPGVGILRFIVLDPSWITHQDADVMALGPFGLVRAARRVRVAVTPPLSLGPPAFAHMYDAPPIRPVFAGPSPGAPKGVELTRGVRPYVPGDARRSVHWRVTAHMGSLMVREREGSGAVRIRVVVAMTRSGPSSVVTAGRANAFVRDFVGRGCEVELVTLQSTGRSTPDVARPYGVAPVERGMPPFVTVTAMVTDLSQLRQRLAMLVVGVPAFGDSKTLTRVISDLGDRWV